MDKGFIQHQQHQIYYEFSNHKTGPAIVYFPGYLSDMTAKKAHRTQAFCQNNNLSCLLFDYIGHGRSSGSLEDVSVAHCIASAQTLIEHFLPKQRIILVASSFGAWVASLIAQQYPQQITGMIYVAPAIDVTKELLLAHLSLEELAAVQKQGYWADQTFHALVNQEVEKDLPEYRITWPFIQESLQHLIFEQHCDFSWPVRILHGTQDQIIPLALSEKFLAHIKTNDAQMISHKTNHSFSEPDDLTLLENTLKEIIQMESV